MTRRKLSQGKIDKLNGKSYLSTPMRDTKYF